MFLLLFLLVPYTQGSCRVHGVCAAVDDLIELSEKLPKQSEEAHCADTFDEAAFLQRPLSSHSPAVVSTPNVMDAIIPKMSATSSQSGKRELVARLNSSVPHIHAPTGYAPDVLISVFTEVAGRSWLHRNVFPTAVSGDPALNISADPGLDAWDAFDTVMILGMLVVLGLFDFFVNPLVGNSIRGHGLALAFMVSASAAFWISVWKFRGASDGVAWLTGYIVELALSMDNLFVFHLVFKAFSVPNDQATRALGIGIYGAICFRLAFILCLTELFKVCYAVDIIIGFLLILSGLFSLNDSEDEEVHNLVTVQFFKWLFGRRLLDSYSKDGSLLTKSSSGELQITVLLLVVCVISVVDCVFAVDSVGSKTGQIKNVYLNVTSCLMAMVSLRSLFFIIKDLADYFDYVKYGICAILCFIGVDMIFSKWLHIPLGYMCLIIVFLFMTSIAASAAKFYWCGKPVAETAYEEQGSKTLEERIDVALKKFDTDGNGLSLEEVRGVVSKVCSALDIDEPVHPENVQQCFEHFDKNRDGELQRSELKGFLIYLLKAAKAQSSKMHGEVAK